MPKRKNTSDPVRYAPKKMVKENELVIQTMHMVHADELKASQFAGKSGVAERLRAMQYQHIASTLPPEFVTKVGYRRAHSLDHMAFELVQGKVEFKQLLAVQKIAKLDVQALLHDIDGYTHQDELSGVQGTKYTLDHTNRVVATICALVAVIGHRVDTSALVGGLGISVPAFLNGASAAYIWITDNWQTIRTLQSRACRQSCIIPGPDDMDELTITLRTVVREQTGLHWYEQPNGPQLRLSQLSLWSTLGINVHKYQAWYASPQAARFGIVQMSDQCCTGCNIGESAAGGWATTRCVRQGGVWVCVSGQCAESRPHRQQFEPLDVNAAWVVIEDEDELMDGGHGQETALDRLLGHLGFSRGTNTNQPGVENWKMTKAWSNANMTQADTADILVRYQVDLSGALANQSNIRKLTSQVRSILHGVGLTLKRVRARVGGVRRYTTYIRTL